MNKCDRCLRPLGDGEQTWRVEVQFASHYGHGFHDERKLEGDVCPACFQDVERTLTGTLGAPSVNPNHTVSHVGTLIGAAPPVGGPR